MKKMKRIISVATLLMLILVLALPTNLYAATTVNVDWDTTYQTIDGFGVSEAFHQSRNISLLGETKQKEIYDLLFSTTKGAGFSIFRSILGDGGTWGNEFDGPNKTMQPSENVWDWTESNDDQLAMYKTIRDEYGIDKLLYTVWSPPAWMKTNGSVVGGSLKTDKYGAYATYLAEHIKNYKSKFGVEITHIGIQNEPDMSTSYSSCTWTPAQFKTFMRDYLVPTFDKEGITAKVVMAEDSKFSEKYAVDSLNDDIAVTRTDIVGAHNYGSTYTTFPTTKAKGKKIWMTEISDMNGNDLTINDGMKWAKQVHDFMTIPQGNAWFYWWGACFKTHNGESLIQIDLNSKTYKVAKRLYTIGQYSRFIRPGWQRISASPSSGSGVSVTAYKDPDTGNFAIVALNEGYSSQSVTFNLKGFTPDTVTPFTTSATQDLAQGSKIPVSGSSFTFNLAANSITTFVGDPEAAGKKLTGYVKPDLEYSSSAAADVQSNFKVEAAGLSALTDENGYFELKNIPKDTTELTVKISKENYLAREIQNVKVTGTGLGSAAAPVIMWAGDIDQNGAINIADVIVLSTYFNTKTEKMDLNKDGAVNIGDIMIIAQHFNTSTKSYPAL
jgi:glucuronoarabinoxylan endo-1,4-beta-xylanase